MSRTTKIHWCDSSVNLMMGCDGCELWQEGSRHCYAGVLTARHGGRKGWPESFDRPRLFLERLDEALRWPDLTGKARPDKPWIGKLPRLVFVNDMGDTFTESLPTDWLAPALPMMAASPHVWILLTKRPRRMAEFFQRHPLPRNFWLCTTVTTQATTSRIGDLLEIEGASVLGVSAEPLLEEVDLRRVRGVERLSWIKAGGESGANARPCQLGWLRRVRDDSRAAGIPVFVKELGSRPLDGDARLRTRDFAGGDWGEWPADLRVREMPTPRQPAGRP